MKRRRAESLRRGREVGAGPPPAERVHFGADGRVRPQGGQRPEQQRALARIGEKSVQRLSRQRSLLEALG